jgi:hypothetical protein
VPRFGALLEAGIRAVPRSDASGGFVEASALVGGLGGAFAPLVSRHYGIIVGPEVFATQATYEGVRTSSAVTASKDSGTAVHISAFGRGWVVVAGPLRASAGLLLGAPLHPIRVVAEHESVTGVGGALFGAELALGAAW